MTALGTPGYRELRATYNLSASGDRWGDALGWWFVIAEVMHHSDLALPDAWQFCDSPVHDAGYLDDPEKDIDEADVIEAYRAGRVTAADLLAFGQVLTRYCALLKAAGQDY